MWDGNHGRIEPAFDQAWDRLTKLRWVAALTEMDTGLRIRVYPGYSATLRNGEWVPATGVYDVLVTGHSGQFTYHDAQRFLDGVTVGARAYRRATTPTEETSS
ncbi:hypothetical protein KGD82_16415 [Nocardiopsis eucommiae]|uniref:Uncharacterized protein n=1 Tax=Nocardiopsis eucommiae TaxID=2831970 RepID=A0A975L6K6_9ACTN|nr:hypothetical protein KGD82_16415 [Nocardiopsis eucommiae]